MMGLDLGGGESGAECSGWFSGRLSEDGNRSGLGLVFWWW